MSDSEEEFIAEEEAEQGPAAIKSLREKLKKAIAEKQEYLEGWQRSRAELVNYKKAEADAHEEMQQRLAAKVLEELVPALDILELSVRHEATPALKMLEKQFLDALGKLKVQRFGAVGDEFDPHQHQALAMQGDDHIIKSVERSGYKLGDHIIRPAQVIL